MQGCVCYSEADTQRAVEWGEGAYPPTQGWVLDSCTFAADTPPS